MATERSIKINIPNKSLLELKKGGYQLVVFRGSASLSEDTKSTVFMTIDAKDLQEQNTITWSDQYYGFISKSTLRDGFKVNASSSRRMDLGDQLHIAQDNTTLKVETPTKAIPSQSIQIVNDGDATVCGYSMTHPHSKTPAQICAASVPGKSNTNIMPLNRYLVMFTSNKAFAENVAVSSVETNAALIEYEQHTESREVTYNYESGLWAQGVNEFAMYGETNGWLKNLWGGVKKVGKVILNKSLNVVGDAAVGVVKSYI